MRVHAGLVLVILLVLVAPASAHQSSFSYATLEMSDDGKRADYEIRLSTRDLFEALELDEDRDATDAEILAGADDLRRYVFESIEITGAGAACKFVPGNVRVLREGDRFAQVEASLLCESPPDAIELHYTLFFDLDLRHEGLLTIGDELVQFSHPDQEDFHFVPARAASSSLVGFLLSGVHHVLFGLDHVLFLVSLLLVIGLRLEDGVLWARTPWQGLRRTAGIVSSFTLGHSMTLIAAALGWFALPSRFVESMIAASIVYVAVENMVRPDPRWRALVGFAFGLMHGMGFAAMLRPLLTPGQTVAPLLVFNVGVELGQLAIVAIALPTLFLAIRVLGPARYRRQFLPPACAVLVVMGLCWLAERALDVELIGF